ncbi:MULTISPECIES: PDZ domain-containing protein [unclassified Streptomyces]|uniref:PDZ domain-containing protein n=1 Tax=unclassified Streptomyces TaxID=2593676 RepID=UPI001F040B14|nr:MULTISPECIES: PDZ domain-containing protein [unclassified Streptomyces]MCH0561638.1 PDZ domain-containing protein [Streptomyces sp. MUM 2J]MCH0568923.1 PDZ domain-containing protein [Streptomyces sp. MUM 136J]
MEQTALRPKPMPGREPGGDPGSGRGRRPHAARRRGRRLSALLFGLSVGTVLVLAGVGLGATGATVIGPNRLADLQWHLPHGGHAQAPAASAPPPASGPSGSETSARASLGVEVMDAEKAGALVVGVHVPGPGHSAGLVHGDVVLAFGRTRVDSAADLARAVARARPGHGITLTVRHRSGGYQQLSAVPGVVT